VKQGCGDWAAARQRQFFRAATDGETRLFFAGFLPLLWLLLLTVLAFAFALAEELPPLPPFSSVPG
jgi:hypothetical protein